MLNTRQAQPGKSMLFSQLWQSSIGTQSALAIPPETNHQTSKTRRILHGNYAKAHHDAEGTKAPSRPQ
jgi:hypothetical protein